MSVRSKKVAWVTGASSGIGATTAIKLAQDGYSVAVSARSLDKLEIVAKEHENIHSYSLDVTDKEACAKTVQMIQNDLGSLDLVLLNAGTYKPDTLNNFDADTFKNHFDINVIGVGNCIDPVLKSMRGKGQGHIAIVASVAGYRGLPRSLSYGPTKAALINMAEALAIECLDTDIKVQVICPGFVRTPLTDQNDFKMPMLMEVEDAANKLIEGLKSNRFEITFPWAFAFMLKILGMLPNKTYFKAVKKGTAGTLNKNA